MREEGYYWVKHRGTWEIAKWFNGGIQGWSWDLGGFGQYDNNFQEIDERRITRPEPEKEYPKCPDPHCEYTGECQASFTANEPCKMNPPSQDWIRARDPNKKGNL